MFPQRLPVDNVTNLDSPYFAYITLAEMEDFKQVLYTEYPQFETKKAEE